jgi:ribosomal protein S12 methylthiotransferase
MSEVASPERTATPTAPKVGFVSLGCPKALTDSELILTQLSAEGYQTSKTFEGADLVIVNTCGFIDDAVRESLDTIGEALAENGRVIVTGCLGAKTGDQGGNLVRQMHPSVLAVTGPHATQEVMDAVHANLPKPHDPFIDLVPNTFGVAGLKLTPRHYAYLKISEGCNHRCTFCIIPSMRGDLVSRPVGDVLSEAKALFEGGVKELLVISQDTSAYGVDVKYRTGLLGRQAGEDAHAGAGAHAGRNRRALRRVGSPALRVPVPERRRGHSLMASGMVLPYLDVPLQHSHPDVLRRMKRPASGEKNLERIARWREVCPELVIRSTFIAGFPGETEQEFEHLLDFIREAEIDRAGCFAYSPVEGCDGQRHSRHAARGRARGAPCPLHGSGRSRVDRQAARASARRCRCWSIRRRAWAARAGWGARTPMRPEIDGTVRLLPPEKISKTLKVGEFTRARIVGAEGHDLIACPFDADSNRQEKSHRRPVACFE